MKKKVLYLMHVDWDWIKQRPHYLAEYLANHCNVLIVYPFFKKRTGLTQNNRRGLRLFPIFFLPGRTYWAPVFMLNKYYMRVVFYFLLKSFRPDFIWVTSPEFIDFLGKKVEGKIIYDCMDDVSQFNFYTKYKERLLRNEKVLLGLSQQIFVSGQHLKEVIQERDLCSGKIMVLRNAFQGPPLALEMVKCPSPNCTRNSMLRIGYVGTIDSWFDNDLLCGSLSDFKNIEYHLVGPLALQERRLKHERIYLYGPINHDKLPSVVKSFDALIMPFIVCDLVRSVDPVKLYEYLNFGKPIISVYYAELERFRPFVNFYSSQEEFFLILKELEEFRLSPKYLPEERIEFLHENSWQQRIKQIEKALGSLP